MGEGAFRPNGVVVFDGVVFVLGACGVNDPKVNGAAAILVRSSRLTQKVLNTPEEPRGHAATPAR